MKNDVEKLFEDYKIRNFSMELTDVAMAQYLISNQGEKGIIYGAGNYGKIVARFLKYTLGLDIYCILDKNPKVDEIEEIKVIKRADYCDGANAIAFIATLAVNKDKEWLDIYNYLNGLGVRLIINLIPILQTVIKENFYTYIVNNKNQFISQYELFADDVSKQTYIEYLRALLTGNGYLGLDFSEKYKYFGTKEEDLYKTDENFVWLNCGSSRGDTLYHFLNKNFSFKKIYAIEGEVNKLSLLKNNIGFLSSGIQNKIEIIPCFVGNAEDETKIDEIGIQEKVSLINMDVEGAERSVLQSAQKIIARDHPVLAVCAYHKPEDLIEIPKLILEICPNYRFVLRKYLSCPGRHYNAIYRTNELVLYAIPK